MNQTLSRIFSFGEQTVRVLGTLENPMFVAADVCRVLDIQNPSQAINGNEASGSIGLDEDEVGICNLYTNAGQRDALCVTESGLYALIFKSRKPEARAFRKWVTSVVLPQIRKTGGFRVAIAGLDFEEAYRLAKTGAVQIRLLDAIKSEQERRMAERIEVEVRQDTDAFCANLMAAFDNGAFGKTRAEYLRYFRAIGSRKPTPGAPQQGMWMSYRFYWKPAEVAEVIGGFMARQAAAEGTLGQQEQVVELTRVSLREALGRMDYWLEGDCKQRFEGAAAPARCWGIEVDRHPMGYLPVTDEAYQAWKASGKADGDPRMGPLFRIIQPLEHPEFCQ